MPNKSYKSLRIRDLENAFKTASSNLSTAYIEQAADSKLNLDGAVKYLTDAKRLQNTVRLTFR